MNLDGQWQYLELIAARRIRDNRTAWHVESPVYTGKSDTSAQFEILGAAGELAARRFLGLPEVLHEGFDGGADINYRNMRIDVKATRLTKNIKHRFLQWPKGKPIKTDVVLFTAVDIQNRCAAVIGYATKDDVLQAPVNEERERPCHEIPTSKLRPPWELMVLDFRKKCE